MAYNQDENFYSKAVHTLPESGLVSERHCGQCQQAGAEYVASETKVPYCHEACARAQMGKLSYGEVAFNEPNLLCGYRLNDGATGFCSGCYQKPVSKAISVELQDGQKALIGVCASSACHSCVQEHVCGINSMDRLKCWVARMRLFRPYRKCHIVAAALMLQDCPETMAHVLPLLYDKVYFDPLHYNRFIAFVHAQLDGAIKALPTPAPSGVTCKQARPYTDPRFVARLLLRMYKLYGKPTCEICRDLETLRCDIQTSLMRLVSIVARCCLLRCLRPRSLLVHPPLPTTRSSSLAIDGTRAGVAGAIVATAGAVDWHWVAMRWWAQPMCWVLPPRPGACRLATIHLWCIQRASSSLRIRVAGAMAVQTVAGASRALTMALLAHTMVRRTIRIGRTTAGSWAASMSLPPPPPRRLARASTNHR
jgi:hypothetical protein